MRSSHVPLKRRSQFRLDEDQYRRLVEEAEVEGRSVSALIREAVDHSTLRLVFSFDHHFDQMAGLGLRRVP